ncbi:hypothetical protein AB205_0070280 [Aquarana catesbeiana]|uniref:Probable splicing factor YJU2B n=1 Tax=Aquarana catesbeiana TaxID=8400 RepID=A0A2G9S5U0_AQUCT|nr:hypothetical protein AB205_0070280 [Aquarana catesbeiana]
MGERKGTNKYYPPDFDPAKHGSLNRYRNSHPLRERARKLSQGILIIRFEMPYNIWCDGCKNHIGMGVRYNAEKTKVGNYYTTPIYRFRMKCHLCVNYIEMQTDPASCDYVIVSGAQRKEERWDMSENEQILTTEHEQKQKLETDSMYRLEHGAADKEKLKKAIPTLFELQEAQGAWKDDFALNSLLRTKFRIVLFLHLPAYDKRQQKKRSEISSRSWFSQGGDVKIQTTNNTLKNLKIRPKPPSSPVASALSLGVVRRESKEGNDKEKIVSPAECEQETTEEIDRKRRESNELIANETAALQTVRNTDTSLPETPPKDRPSKQPATPSCLVPDYSDSSSESES